MSSIQNHENIVKGWIKKGDGETDSFFKFISYWIAFNCWLTTKTNEYCDRDALDKLYKEPSLYGGFSSIVNDGNNKKLFDALVGICPIENNRKRTKRPVNDYKNFAEVMNVLYEIRCNLFHGSKIDSNERDAQVMRAAVPVLELIVKTICK